MSGGEVVSTRGGIDVRTDDLRAAAQIISELGLTLRQEINELRARTNSLPYFMYNETAMAQLESGSVARTRGAADEAVRLSDSLWSTADSYDEGESRIERMAGNAVAFGKNATKAYVGLMSGGLLDTPYGWDPRGLETGGWLLDMTGLGAVLAGMAAILDWRRPPVVARTGADTSAAGTSPPTSASDLLTNVQQLERSGASDVTVQFLEYDDGRPRQVIVSLPGTSRWTAGSDVPTDVAADLLAVQGLPTSYSAGVIEILELAGVTAADSILLVGHSLGGMVAAQLASELSGSRQFRVTNVVTAGAPIAKIDIPDDVEVIALENKDDPVPYTDSGRNEDSDNVVTITVETGTTGIDAHTLDTGYLPAADAVAASDVPQIQHALEGLQPYLDADRSTTLTYTIARS